MYYLNIMTCLLMQTTESSPAIDKYNCTSCGLYFKSQTQFDSNNLGDMAFQLNLMTLLKFVDHTPDQNIN